MKVTRWVVGAQLRERYLANKRKTWACMKLSLRRQRETSEEQAGMWKETLKTTLRPWRRCWVSGAGGTCSPCPCWGCRMVPEASSRMGRQDVVTSSPRLVAWGWHILMCLGGVLGHRHGALRGVRWVAQLRTGYIKQSLYITQPTSSSTLLFSGYLHA